MSIRNLDAFFRPRSIVLIGGSRRPGSLGQVMARNLGQGGFQGPLYAVHPEAKDIAGIPAYPSVARLPLPADLAVICTPPDTVPGLIGELAKAGTRGAVVITAGFGEGQPGPERDAGMARRRAMLQAARTATLRIVGPNCLGLLAPLAGVNASFGPVPARPGKLALLSQSGAIVTAMVDWATHHGIGFSAILSLGDSADVDAGDMLDWCATDASTSAVLLYLEAVTDARKFMSAARAAARAKPVIVMKTGRFEGSARAAQSHTGALGGSDAVFDAAVARAGMLRVHNLTEFFEAAEALAGRSAVRGNRLTILTNGGGLGVLAAEALEASGGRLATLDEAAVAALDQALPRTWSHGNPVDIIGDATPDRYVAALRALAPSRSHDAVLVVHCPTAVTDGAAVAKAVLAEAEANRLPLVTCWVGEGSAAEARAMFSKAGVPSFQTPDQAVAAFMHLYRYRRNQELLMQMPPVWPEVPADAATRARDLIEKVLRDGRTGLTQAEALALLEAYGVPVVRTATAVTPDVAARIAAEMNGPVALKILSPDISHKSDIGGVRLGLRSPQEVEAAAREMQTRIAALKPEARIDGFLVQLMAPRREAHELILGIGDDAVFGPFLLFGKGGVEVEVVADRAIGLPPLNPLLARALIQETRVARLLAGYRDRPAADLDGVVGALLALSQIVVDVPEIRELDINPLLASEKGVLALDARVRVSEVKRPPLAISPYPRELAHTIRDSDGAAYLLRPVRPEDEPKIRAMLSQCTPNDIRLRFLTQMRELSKADAARLTQIDYARQMAFLAFQQDAAGSEGELAGVVRLAADADLTAAEYAIMVRSDLKGHGLGYVLMREIIAYARRRGIGRLYGHVLRENVTMLGIAADLGFRERSLPDDMSVIEVSLDLSRAA
ncbi:bifunctional acetate--CoA ligase family protein/GNAT family N-acetyltransferase [Desertibaculum subflavum]|uniref:bifunctional acetate--CoA ligase family protein/GNAT family N-acetyltransferase n=1 Tax=Desertibaculum subflavum TaxID=2268458 RepID=UPI000E66EE94